MQEENNKKYYYFIGVRTRVGNDLVPKLSCDFILKYTSDEIKKIDLARAMVDNELFPTSQTEAIDAVELNSLNDEINAISMRVRFNPISVHKFISSHELDEDWFDMYVNLANNCDYTRQKLVDARINF